MSFKGVQIKGLDKIEKDFKAFLKASEKNPIILKDVGETTVNYIKGSVRARRDEYKMGDLKPKSAALRKALEKYNEVGDTFSPKRSNLTFTGELLDAMKHKINTGTGKVTIYFTGAHKQLKGKNGQLIGEPQTNAEIAAKLNSNPKFRFLFISEKLETTLKNRIIAGMRRQLANYRKVRKILG